MSAVQTTVKLNDMMSPALKKMLGNMQKLRQQFEDFQHTADKSWDSSKADEMRHKMDSMNSSIRNLQNEMQDFGSETDKATQATGNLEGAIGKVATAIGGIMGIRQIADWVGGALESANVENSAKTQLQATMRNMGNLDGYDALIAKADEIQQAGIYGNEAMIGAIAEFSTYMTDTDAISMMVDTLTDYAAGMTGGGAVDYDQMVNFATNLGKITTGAYDAMTKKGFQFTDAQKAVLKGTAKEAQYVEALGEDYKKLSSDMQQAKIINDVIAESWDGMYEAMSNTPEASVIRLQNAWGDVQEVIGNELYPSVQKLADTIMENLPEIQEFLVDMTTPIKNIIDDMAQVVEWTSKHKAEAEALATTLLTIGATYGEIKVAVDTAKWAQEAFNGACDTNPWIALLGVILAIINTIIIGRNMNEEAQEQILVGWKSVVSAILLLLAAPIVPLAILYGAFLDAIDGIGLAFTYAFHTAQAQAYISLSAILRMVQEVANAIAGMLGQLGAMASFNNQVNSWRNDLQTKAKESTQNALNTPWDQFGSNTKRFVTETLPQEFNDITNVVDAGVDEFLGMFGITGYTGKGLLTADDVKVDLSNFGNGGGGGGGNIPKDIASTAGNTGKMAKALDIADEELKYLRDIAERDTINRFTTAEIKVNMNNNNNINSEMDIDGIVSSLETKLYESLVSTAEAVHV